MPRDSVGSEDKPGTRWSNWLQTVRNAFRLSSNLSVETDNEMPRTGRKETAGMLYDSFSEYLPWTSYNDQTGFFTVESESKGKVEGIAFAIEVIPQTGANRELAATMSDFATMGAPVGTGITVSMYGSPDIDWFRDQWQESVKPPEAYDDPDVREMAATLRDMSKEFGNHLQGGTIDPIAVGVTARIRTFRCVLSMVIPTTDPDKPEAIEKAEDLRSQMEQKLRNFSMFSHHWDPNDLLDWADAICNPQAMFEHDRPVLHYDDSRELRHQVIRSDTRLDVEPDGLRFRTGERGKQVVARSYSVRSYPPAATLHAMKNLLGSDGTNTINYPCPFVFTAGAVIQDFDKEKGITTAKALRAQQTAESPMAKMLPSAQDTNADYKLALRAFEGAKGTVQMFHQLLLFTRPGEEDGAKQCARSVFRSMGWEIGEDLLHHAVGLFSALPMTFGPAMQSDYKRMKKLSTKTGDNVGNLLPLIGTWTGTPRRPHASCHKPQFMLISRQGQPMLIDVFANGAGNFNGSIVGASGSGKSFAANSLVMRTLAEGGRVWVIDVGGSYEKLCELLGGQYMRFSESSRMSLNPFSMVPIDSDIAAEIEIIAPVLEMMATKGAGLEPYLRVMLETAVRDIWHTIETYAVDPRKVMTITMVAEALKMNCAKGNTGPYFQARLNNMIKGFLRAKGYDVAADEDPEQWGDTFNPENCDVAVREMGVALARFAQEGTYGRWFEDPSTISFNSPFVVLELEELNQKPDLRAVVMMLLMQSITTAMYQGDREQKMLCLIDEAWDLLSARGSGPFIEAGYRRARKYGGCFWTATQNVADYEKSDTAQAAFQNSDWVLLLRQKPESVVALAQSGKMALDAHQLDMVRSVTRAGNAYSEIFVKGGDFPPAIGRLFADPFTAMVSSSTAEDVAAIARLRKGGMTMAEAIHHLINQNAQAKQRKAA